MSSDPSPGLIVSLVIVCLLAVGAVGTAVVLALQGGGDDPAQPAAAAQTRTVVEVVKETRDVESVDRAHRDTASEQPGFSRPSGSDRRYDRGAYSIRLPRSWSVEERSVDHGAYVESVWRAPDGSGFLVDHTPGYDGTPESGARAVRDQTAKAAGYTELSFGPTRVAGRDAWEWTFELGGKRKTDWFLTACGTGFAALAAAPPGTFARSEATFRRIVDSLEPNC